MLNGLIPTICEALNVRLKANNITLLCLYRMRSKAEDSVKSVVNLERL